MCAKSFNCKHADAMHRYQGFWSVGVIWQISARRLLEGVGFCRTQRSEPKHRRQNESALNTCRRRLHVQDCDRSFKSLQLVRRRRGIHRIRTIRPILTITSKHTYRTSGRSIHLRSKRKPGNGNLRKPKGSTDSSMHSSADIRICHEMAKDKRNDRSQTKSLVS